jgi:hypothetical protein
VSLPTWIMMDIVVFHWSIVKGCPPVTPRQRQASASARSSAGHQEGHPTALARTADLVAAATAH